MTAELHGTAAARLREVDQRYTASRRPRVPCMRKILSALACLAVLSACGGDGGGSGNGRLDVVASFFPVAELAREVGGGDVRTHDLTPPGVEPHELELTADQVDRIEDADVLLYLGDDFQPAVERAVRRADGARVDLLTAVPDRIEGDPHVWLDPVIVRSLIDRVSDAFAAAEPAHADAYRARAVAYATKLDALHVTYQARLRNCDRRVIVTTHEAFAYLARRYGLRQEALTGRSPEAEPDPRRQADLLDLVRDEGVTTVFTEGGEEARAAEALAREAGVRAAVLRPLELPVPGGYIQGMQDNLDVLVAALGCR